MTRNVLFILAFSLSAAEAPKPEVTQSHAPQVTAEHRAHFWRASSELMRAQAAFDKAKTEMQADCGTAALIIGQDGEPACQAQPAKIAPEAGKK